MVDFYVKSSQLAIEVDGSAHDTQKSYDAGRDKWLYEAYGVRTLRLTNDEVLKTTQEALERIMKILLECGPSR